MKNKENKPLRIVYENGQGSINVRNLAFMNVLSRLAIAESNLVKAGKDSAMPHFLAIVKELEEQFGFHFEVLPPEAKKGKK